jgi:hypothetical protein
MTLVLNGFKYITIIAFVVSEGGLQYVLTDVLGSQLRASLKPPLMYKMYRMATSEMATRMPLRVTRKTDEY